MCSPTIRSEDSDDEYEEAPEIVVTGHTLTMHHALSRLIAEDVRWFGVPMRGIRTETHHALSRHAEDVRQFGTGYYPHYKESPHCFPSLLPVFPTWAASKCFKVLLPILLCIDESLVETMNFTIGRFLRGPRNQQTAVWYDGQIAWEIRPSGCWCCYGRMTVGN